MKIALFKDVKYEYEVVGGESLEGGNSYVRASEYVDIEFKKLPYGDAENAEIEIIDNQMASEMAGFECSMNKLKQRKAELLALPGAS